jgi:hypothetical protein
LDASLQPQPRNIYCYENMEGPSAGKEEEEKEEDIGIYMARVR